MASNQLYVGNLPRDVTDIAVRDMFENAGVDIAKVTLKPGFAFVECSKPDGISASITALKGGTFLVTHLCHVRYRLLLFYI